MMSQLLGTWAVVAGLAFSGAAYGQEVRATITGSVTDPAGAPVSGAAVTVTHTTTNAAVVTRTTESGNYVTPLLTPGKYVLTVEQTGFKKFIREAIELESLDKARVDVRLEIGALSDSVTVNSTVSVLQTDTATRGQTISSEMLENIPTMGRNPFQLAWSAPGIVKTGSFRYLRAFDIGGTSGFSVNGGKNQENEVLLDGISDVQSSRQVIGVPTIDSVQEFAMCPQGASRHQDPLNATTRLHMRRLTRLTLAFSKKLENFEAAVGLHFAYYNLVKRHGTIRCTPAMAAGVERSFWSVGELVEAATA
jgi:Carboxypeptidase regulatory-like domain